MTTKTEPLQMAYQGDIVNRNNMTHSSSPTRPQLCWKFSPRSTKPRARPDRDKDCHLYLSSKPSVLAVLLLDKLQVSCTWSEDGPAAPEFRRSLDCFFSILKSASVLSPLPDKNHVAPELCFQKSRTTLSFAMTLMDLNFYSCHCNPLV